jgi:lysophospholipase L1-like esterase
MLIGAMLGVPVQTPVMAQSFLDVPYITTQSPEVFRDLFARARCGTVRILMLGDSQETTPGGAGTIYVPRLQHEFWTRIGNAPETPWMQLRISTGGGQPYADYLWRGGHIQQGVTAPRLPLSAFPPGQSGAKTSTTNGNNVNGNQFYGNLLLLQHDCANVNPDSELRGLHQYFDRTARIALDVMAASNPSSGEVRVRVTPSPSDAMGFFFPTTAVFDMAMGLERPTVEMVVGRVGPLPMGSGYSMQVELSGTDPTKFTDLITARFVNMDDPRGFVMTSLSAGGYKALDVQYYHPGCGPILGAMQPDFIMICFGANDSSGVTPPPNSMPITPARYRADLESLIAFVRSHTRADLPVILVSDPARMNLPNQTAGENLDAQPGIHAAMALADPLVCALNSRRLTHEAGWTPTGGTPYLSDGVHYTPLGARLKAALEAQALFDAFFPPFTDCNANGVDDRCDILSGTSLDLNADGVPDECACDPDLNADGNTDQDDIACLAQAVAGDASCTTSDADFNRDGNVDQDDVDALAQVVGGAPCP